MKKIEVSNVPARREQRIEEFEDKTIALDKQLYDIMASDGHLLFLDECVFKQRDFKRRTWSNSNENIAVEDRTPN